MRIYHLLILLAIVLLVAFWVERSDAHPCTYPLIPDPMNVGKCHDTRDDPTPEGDRYYQQF